MVDALATDFVAAGFEVQRMIDTTVYPAPEYRFSGQTYHAVNGPADERPLFAELAQASDATVVIAVFRIALSYSVWHRRFSRL